MGTAVSEEGMPPVLANLCFGEGSSQGGVVDVNLRVRASMVAEASECSSKLTTATHGGEDTVPVFSCAWVGANEKGW